MWTARSSSLPMIEDTGRELWMSNGTARGTIRLRDIYTGTELMQTTISD